MRARVVRALRPLSAIPVENSVWPGTPDVAHALGWVELKSATAWPVRPATALAVDHFTQVQRLWHTRWADCGGASLVILRVGAEWLAFRGTTAAAQLGRATQAELLACAEQWWAKTPDDGELLRCVQVHARRTLMDPLPELSPRPPADERAAAT